MGTHPIFESDFDCLTARMSITKSAEWAKLVDLSKTVGQSSIREAFQADPARFDKFNLKLNEDGNELLFDFSKNRIDESVMAELRNLAKVANVEEMKKKKKKKSTRVDTTA